MGQLNEQLATARARLAEARGRFDELKKITPKMVQTAATLPDVLQSSVVSNLRGQYAELARRRAELVTRYGPKHPQVPVVQAQVDDMAGQITQEINRIVASARLDFEAATSREQSLQKTLDGLKNNAAEFNQAAVRLHELQRDAQVNREMFQAFLARAKETAAQSGAELPDSRIVSSATSPPAPSYPPRLLFAGLGLFGSVGLGDRAGVRDGCVRWGAAHGRRSRGKARAPSHRSTSQCRRAPLAAVHQCAAARRLTMVAQ